MVISDASFHQIEVELEDLFTSLNNLDSDSPVVKDLKLRFGLNEIADWYYGYFFGRLYGYAEASAIRNKGGILDDNEIDQINAMVKSFGNDIKDTITRFKSA